MNNLRSGLILITLCLTTFSCRQGFRDQDGNGFRVVKIDNTIWMAENLNTSHFRNGDSIPRARSIDEWLTLTYSGKPVWIYLENDPGAGKKYGKYYNWWAVNDPRGIAPKGWHVATDEEWSSIIKYLGGEIAAAMRLRSSASTGSSKEDEGNLFSGVPSGGCNNKGVYFSAGSRAYWWSATEALANESWAYVLNYLECNIKSNRYDKGFGFPVRCVKD